ncbi:phage tail length tape measure family protein [Massilia sp. DD77]|uniref:phage tail length tape measure family protein n=1 Tax=Massilia sp. DD77 TaxID=3109349 RepID=UPI002FFEF578
MTEIVNEATIRVVADASGVEAGLRPAVDAAQRAGHAISQSGASAAGSARAVDAAQRSIIASIQRTTLAMEAGGRSTAAYFEQMGNQRAVDPTSLAPYLSQLRAVEAAQAQAAQAARDQAVAERELAQAQATKDSFLAGLREQIALYGRSADEVMRFRAAQAGASQEAAHLILQLQNMRAAHEEVAQAARAEAQAQREAAQAQASRDSFIESLTNQVNAIGRTRSELLEMQAAQMGLTQQAAPLIQRLRETEQAVGATGMTAAETANALRQVPMQVTDIITSLQGGMNPLTVAIQQGGQLRDSFGGVAPAARALGAELAKLVNPYTLVAAAAATLALAYFQGSKEGDGYNRALIMSGNAAGTSRNQLADLAREISKTTGTQAKASEAVAALAGSGQVGAKNLREFGLFAVQMERDVSQSVESTVNNFADLGKSPVEASLKLNEAYNYLTASTLAQIKALEEQGRKEEASEMAQKAYATAFTERAAQMRENLGLIEGAWRGATDTAKAAWDAFLGVGRKQTPKERLDEVNKALADAAKAPSVMAGGDRASFSAMTQNALNASNKDALLKEKVELEFIINKEAWDSAQAAISQQLQKSMTAWDSAGDQYLTKAEKLANAEKKIRAAGEAAGVSEQAIVERIALARAESVNASIEDSIAGLHKLDGVAEIMLQRELGRIATRKALGQIGEDEAIRAAAQKDLARLAQQEKQAERQLALTRKMKDSQRDVADAESELQELRAKRESRQAQLENDLAVAQFNRAQVNEENHARGIQSAEAELKSLKDQVDAQVLANAEIGLSKIEVADLASKRLLAAAALKEEAAAIQAMTPEGKRLAEIYREQAAELRSLATAKQTGAVKQDAADTSRKALEELNQFLDPSRAQTFGEALREAFGGAGESLSKLTATLDGFGKRQAEIAKHRATAERERGSKDLDEIAYLNKISELNERETKDRLSSYGSMTSAAAGFFGEQSKGYQALMSMSQVFHAAELAMTLAELVPKGIAAVLSQGAGDPYTAFGRMAAMAAIVTGLGVAIGSVSGSGPSLSEARQKSQGTDTVLGSDDKTESIAKSLDLIERAAFQDLNISVGMLTSLRNIESNIGNFAALLVRDTGVTGDFGKGLGKDAPGIVGTLGKVGGGVAGGLAGGAIAGAMTMGTIGATSLTMLGAIAGPLGMAAGAIIGGILGDKLVGKIFGGKQTVEDTGFTFDKTDFASIFAGGLQAMQYAEIKKDGGWFGSDKYSTKTEGLGAEGNRQIASVLTSLYDTVFEAGKLLALGTDSFSTRLNSFVVDIGKVSLKGLSDDEIQKELEAVFSKVGDDLAKFGIAGLERFQQVGEGYLETLSRVAADYQAVTVVTEALGMSFSEVGLGSVDARERLIALAGGLDEFTSSAEKFMADFYTEKERADSLRARITPTLDQFGIKTGAEDSLKQFRDVVTGLDLTTAAGAEAYATLMQIAPVFKQIADIDAAKFEERIELQNEYDELTMTSAQLLIKQRNALDESNRALFDQIQAIKAQATAVQSAKDAAANVLGGVDSMFSALQSVVGREKTRVQEYVQAQTAIVDRLKGLSGALHSTLDGMRTGELTLDDRARAQAQIRASLAIARAGGRVDAGDVQKALSVVSQDASSMFASQQDYLRDFYTTQSDIAALAGVTDQSLSVEEQSLEKLNDQLEYLDAIVANGQEQINALKGQSIATLTLADAMAAFAKSVSIAKANPIASSGGSIASLYMELLGRAPDASGLEFWKDKLASGITIDEIRKAFMAGDEYKGRKLRGFDVGTNRVPYDMPAMIHEDERIIPAADNRELMRRLASPPRADSKLLAEVAGEVRALRETVFPLLYETAKNTGRGATSLDRMDRVGLKTRKEATV